MLLSTSRLNVLIIIGAEEDENISFKNNLGYHGKEISFHSNTGLHDISLQIAFIGFTSMI